jgi:hypothetical protein
MVRSEREDLALQQLDNTAAGHVLPDLPAAHELARRPEPAAPAAEAAADRLERDTRQRTEPQPPEPVPVPAPPWSLRTPDPLAPIRGAVGPELVDAVDVDQLRRALSDRDSQNLRDHASALRPLLSTFPHDPAEARKHARQADYLDERGASARAAIDAARDEADALGRLERRRRRDEVARRIDHAETQLHRLDHDHTKLQAQIHDERTQTDAWLAANGDALCELVAIETELLDRAKHDRQDRVTATLHDPPEPITLRVGARPDDPTAREAWDRAAAHLSDYQDTYGQLPEDQPPHNGSHRRAWTEVQRSHAEALQRSPHAPGVEIPAADADLGPDLGP